jgi:two-component system, OmpR family, response regulator RegX3
MPTNPDTNQDLRRALVVEDDQSVRRMLRFSLRASGFTIAETATGAEALHLLERLAPDAVILDLSLPDGLGGAVLERLRELEGENHSGPDWMVISALDREDVVRLCGPLGYRFLPKPFDPWELVNRLEAMLSAKGES